MGDERAGAVRVAGVDDAPAAGRLLHDFNAEFGDPTMGAEAVGERLAELIGVGETEVLLAEDGEQSVGLAVVRFRPALTSPGGEAYLAELYVVPELRGQGFGAALLDLAIERSRGRGADWILLGTSEDDREARRLYESRGFRNREGSAEGPVMFFYEREL